MSGDKKGQELLEAYRRKKQAEQVQMSDGQTNNNSGAALLQKYKQQQAAKKNAEGLVSEIDTWFKESAAVNQDYNNWYKNGGISQSDEEIEQAYSDVKSRRDTLIGQSTSIKNRLWQCEDIYGKEMVDKLTGQIDSMIKGNTATLDAWANNKSRMGTYRTAKAEADKAGMTIADPVAFYWNQKSGEESLQGLLYEDYANPQRIQDTKKLTDFLDKWTAYEKGDFGLKGLLLEASGKDSVDSKDVELKKAVDAYAKRNDTMSDLNSLLGKGKSVLPYLATGLSDIDKMTDEQKLAYIFSPNSVYSTVTRTELQREDLSLYDKHQILMQKGYTTEAIDTLLDFMVDMGEMSPFEETKLQGVMAKYKKQQDMVDQQVEFAQDHPVVSSAMSIPLNVGGGFTAAIEDVQSYFSPDGIDLYSDGNTMQASAEAIRETVSDKIDNSFLQFLYQSGMSAADSTFTSAMGMGLGVPEVSIILMSSGAAASTIRSAKQRGLSDDRAMATGVAAGISEALFEYVSLENLKQVKSFLEQPAQTLGKKILKVAAQSGIEGTEELFTDIANCMTDLYINGGEAEIAQNIDAYEAKGMSEEEAIKKALGDFAVQLGLSFAGGALSGSMMSGSMAVVSRKSSRALGKSVRTSGYTQALVDMANELVPNGKYTKLVQEQLSKGDSVSDATLGRLMKEVMPAYKGSVQTDVCTHLKQAGINADMAESIAQKLVDGEQISRSEADILRQNAAARAYMRDGLGVADIDEMDSAGQIGQALRENAWRVYSVQTALDAFDRRVATAAAEKTRAGGTDTTTGTMPVTDTNSGEQSDAGDSVALRDGYAATVWVTGEPVTVTGIDAVSDGRMKVALSDGDTMELADLELEDAALASVLNAAAEYPTATARAFVSGYDKVLPLNTYKTGFDYIRQQAMNGMSYEQAVKTGGAFVQQMSVAAQQNAYAAGLNEANRTVDTNKNTNSVQDALKGKENTNTSKEQDEEWLKEETKRVLSGQAAQETKKESIPEKEETKTEVELPAKNVEAKKPAKTTARHQYVPIDAKTRQQLVEVGVNARSINKMDRLAKALNRQVILYYEKGTNINGYEKDGVLYINMASKASRYYTVLGHELTHSLERSKLYTPLKNYLLNSELLTDWLKKNGFVDLDEAVQNRIALYKANGNTLNIADAERDIVADLCGEYVIQGKYDSVMKLRVYSSRLFTAVRNFIESMYTKLVNRFGHGDTLTKQLREVRDMYRRVMLDAEKAEKQGQNGKQYSISPSFYQQLDNWDGQNPSVTFTVGTTSKALQSVGIKDQEIKMRSGMMLSKMNKHAEVKVDTFRQIPELLEHPVIVQFSDAIDPKTGKPKYDSRITVLGELYADIDVDGQQVSKPVLVSMELLPTNQKGTTILDFSVVTSAYAKKALQGYINDNSILYIEPNKKRTDNWLSLNRLQLPVGENQYGSVRKITYTGGKVKIQNSKNKTNMQTALEKAGVIDSYGTSISKKKATGDGKRRYSISPNKQMDALVEEYGAIPKGEKPAVDVDVPQRSSENKRVRRFVRTVLESGILTDDMMQDVDKAIVDEALSYTPVTDKQTENEVQRILDRGVDKAWGMWEEAIADNKLLDKKHMALGGRLLAEAAKAGDTKAVMTTIADLAEAGTRGGQSIQATRMLKNMTGIGQLLYVQRTVNHLNQDIEAKNIKRSDKKKITPIEIDESLATDLAEAKTTEESEQIADLLLQDIADQVDSSFFDKWNAWRYLSMLGNLRTHIRNLLGNVIFLPAVRMKDAIAIPLEKALVKNSGTYTKVLRVEQSYREFAWQDFEEMREILTGNGKYNPSDPIRDRKRIFKSEILETLRKTNSWMLEAEDAVFLRRHYVHALGSYLQANHIDLEHLDERYPTERAVLNTAREYALREAQKATYRDESALADTLANMSRQNMAANILVEGIMPFKKTPINILKRGVEYSPAGLIWTIMRGTQQLRQGSITINEYIDGLAAGLTGTGIVALGMFLASIGLVGGGLGDDKEDEFSELQGEQAYSIRIGDHSYTIDWMAPATIPLFIGVELMNAIQGEHGNVSFADVADVLSNMTEPMVETSMLSGISDLIDSVSYGENSVDKFSTAILETVSNYFQQGIPTILGQLARTIDSTRRKIYIDKDISLPSSIQYTLQKIRNKIPGLSFLGEPYMNEWGRKDTTDNVLVRAFQNFVSPGYISEIERGPVEEELQRLYDQTGENSVLPSMMEKYITIDGERTNLSAKEYTVLTTTCGQTAYGLLEKVIADGDYDALSDNQKVSIIDGVYDLAKAVAKQAVSDYEPDGWVATALDMNQSNGIPLETYLVYHETAKELTADKDENGNAVAGSKKDKVVVLIDSMNLTNNQKDALYVEEGYAESSLNKTPWHKK